MKLLITGICGFVGSSLARGLQSRCSGLTISGIDSLARPGSEANRLSLRSRGIRVVHGDVRCASDFEQLPPVDWVIDAAANPSVLAGTGGRGSSRQLVEHNLLGTFQTLEYCKACKAGLVLLSSSRIYSIRDLNSIPLLEAGNNFVFDESRPHPPGVSAAGLSEAFSTTAPVSLYGATKLASEALALEYGETFGFPVWINRCGVLAGAGQFGTAEQGIFSFWLHAHAQRRPLGFCGFGGRGLQVRDALHPNDLATLVISQITGTGASTCGRIFNVGGGVAGAMSLAQLTEWCDCRFGRHPVAADSTSRPFDVPWVVMDSTKVQRAFGWNPTMRLAQILDEIATHAESHPEWLTVTGA